MGQPLMICGMGMDKIGEFKIASNSPGGALNRRKHVELCMYSSCRLNSDQHVSDTPLINFTYLLNVITQYFAQIFCLPKEATVQKMVNAPLL